MLFILLSIIPLVSALNNNVGFLPEMGFNTWYMLHNHLINYNWAPGYCMSCDAQDVAAWFVENGLLDLGYQYANFDDCIVVGRDPKTGELIPDPSAFPQGVEPVVSNFSRLGFVTGWYTVRNNITCASGPPPRLMRPGSNGYEKVDAAWYASVGLRYLKDDSCGSPAIPYPVMGAALNATGADIFFSMCEPGQGPQTAPIGRQIGNGWRIDEDDGGLWRPILDNVNMNAPLFPFSGCDEQHTGEQATWGCGYNDMGLLMVGGGMTADQDAAHMALWAIMATKLLISVDPRNFNAHSLSLVKNKDLIAIDQDGLKLQGQRVIPPVNASRSAEDAVQIRAWKVANLEGGSWKAAGRSHELLAGGDAGAIPGTEQDELLANGGRFEVWQRQLVNGAWALLLFNNGLAATTEITCNTTCWTRMGWAPTETVSVYDVLAQTTNGTTVGGFTASVRVNATVLVRLTS